MKCWKAWVCKGDWRMILTWIEDCNAMVLWDTLYVCSHEFFDCMFVHSDCLEYQLISKRALLFTLVIISVSNGTFDGLVKHTIEYTPFWCVVIDSVLIGNVSNETFPRQKICKRACHTDPKCISINFQLKGGQCEFSSANHANSSGGLSEKNGWIYIYNSHKVGRRF